MCGLVSYSLQARSHCSLPSVLQLFSYPNLWIWTMWEGESNILPLYRKYRNTGLVLVSFLQMPPRRPVPMKCPPRQLCHGPWQSWLGVGPLLTLSSSEGNFGVTVVFGKAFLLFWNRGSNNSLFSGLLDWLKSLRLHKYAKILLELSYEQLLDLTDEELKAKGLTFGARGKILKNIGFMKQRPNLLAELSFNLDVSTIIQPSQNPSKWAFCWPFHEKKKAATPRCLIQVAAVINGIQKVTKSRNFMALIRLIKVWLW